MLDKQLFRLFAGVFGPLQVGVDALLAFRERFEQRFPRELLEDEEQDAERDERPDDHARFDREQGVHASTSGSEKCGDGGAAAGGRITWSRE
ncbi:MAG: hypothetical protein IPP94_08350 [Ignavibacteria bacterium]|nr:hypothetical protein [Ignavibacteria bacterium]